MLGPGPHLGRRAARHHGDAPAPPAPATCRWWSRSTASATPSTSTWTRRRPPTPTTPSPGRATGYAVLTYTARGLWGSCGTPESRLASPVGVRERLHPPRRRPLRGPRHPGADRPAGRRGHRRPRRDRRHRRQLRRRPVADAGRAARPRDAARRHARALAQPGRHAAADRRRRAGDPVDRPRLRRGAERPRVRQRDHPALAGDLAGRGREGLGRQRDLRRGAVRDRARPAGRRAVRPRPADGLPGAAGARPRGRRDARGSRAPTPASPTTTPRRQAIVELLARYHSAYYVPPSRAPAAAAARVRLHRRPVSRSTRCCASPTAPRERYPGLPLSLLLGDFGHQRASNKPRERDRLLRSIHALVRPSPARPRRRPPATGVTAFAQTCPAKRAAARAVSRAAASPRLARGELRVRLRASRRRSARPAATRRPAPRSTRRRAAATAASRSMRGRAPGTAAYARPVTAPPRRHPARRADGERRSRVDGAAPANTQIAARLWDVAPGGRPQRLVARGLYRPAAQGRATLAAAPGRLEVRSAATRSSSSCWAPTRPTRGPRTAPSRSRSRG